MAESWDLSNDCWVPLLGDDETTRPGQVFIAPLADVDENLHLQITDEDPARVLLPVEFSYALVVSVFRRVVVVVPVTTADDVDDQDLFRTAVESATQARFSMRLPELDGHWSDGALATLFEPCTLPIHLLREPPAERIAHMRSDASELVARRFARALAET